MAKGIIIVMLVTEVPVRVMTRIGDGRGDGADGSNRCSDEDAAHAKSFLFLVEDCLCRQVLTLAGAPSCAVASSVAGSRWRELLEYEFIH